ncbi:MAG TPA: Rv3235 family protein [Microbacteriaceae bacterium]|nr:Rv3235 family protein [Microbacteriaceae bacterium]
MTAELPWTEPGRRTPYYSRPRDEDLFGVQPTSTAELPDPRPLVENLSRCVVEAYAGARDIEQLARWVTDRVFQNLLARLALASRARRAKGVTPKRPHFTIGSTRLCAPRDGVVEAVVLIHAPARTRAVAIRLEGLDRRWRATAIHVL